MHLLVLRGNFAFSRQGRADATTPAAWVAATAGSAAAAGLQKQRQLCCEVFVSASAVVYRDLLWG